MHGKHWINPYPIDPLFDKSPARSFFNEEITCPIDPLRWFNYKLKVEYIPSSIDPLLNRSPAH